MPGERDSDNGINVAIKVFHERDDDGRPCKILLRSRYYKDMIRVCINKIPALRSKRLSSIRLYARFDDSIRYDPSAPLGEIDSDIWENLELQKRIVQVVVRAVPEQIPEREPSVTSIPDSDSLREEKHEIVHSPALLNSVLSSPPRAENEQVQVPKTPPDTPATPLLQRKSGKVETHRGDGVLSSSLTLTKRRREAKDGDRLDAWSIAPKKLRTTVTSYVGRRRSSANKTQDKGKAPVHRTTPSASEVSDSESSSEDSSSSSSPSVTGSTAGPGNITLAQHLEIEHTYLRKPKTLWVMPPPSYQPAVRAYIDDVRPPPGAPQLNMAERHWLGRRMAVQSSSSLPNILIVAPGEGLYRLMIKAHGKHLGIDRTFERLRELCFAPPRAFIEDWVKAFHMIPSSSSACLSSQATLSFPSSPVVPSAETDVTWSLFCKDMLANVDYIFTRASDSDEDLAERLFATREHLLLTAAEIGTRYNQRRPISRLPVELLHRIFCLVADDYPPRPYDSELDRAGHLGWISLTHVCQRWRNVLLDMPSLWATCTCHFSCAMKEFVSRAQRSPITLHLDTRRVRPTLAPSIFSTTLSYIRLGASVDLTLPVEFQETLVYVLTTYDLPAVEILNLNVLRDPKEKSLPLAQLELPRLQAPKLRQCRMTNVLIPLAAPALTHLELVRDTAKDVGFAQPAAFISVLTSAPHLETLRVENWIPDCTRLLGAGSEQLVALPKLKSISLASTPARCEALWRMLHIPRTARLILDLHRASRDLVDLPALFSLLNAIAPHMQLLPNHAIGRASALSIEEDGESSFHFRIYDACNDDARKDGTGSVPLSPLNNGYRERLRVRLTDGARFEWAEELPSLLSALGAPASGIQTLSVRMFPPTVAARWQIFLRAFGSVRVLHVCSFTVDDQPPAGLVSALAMEDLMGGAPGTGSAGWMLPALRELWMRDVVLEEPSSRRSMFQERLLDTLRVRPVARLRITRMPTDVDAFPAAAGALQEDFLARAKELVPNVEWNREDEGRVSMEDHGRHGNRSCSDDCVHREDGRRGERETNDSASFTGTFERAT
ncbi:hypothetical protein K488DRAFT_86614 [Vararia minispora EC-137]|uniref:Uncharacterized protein n=1 Tax=Vararia minispora EC-137 TaxID=1314806 RepID=A0ACB8QJ58_9AGAM|nr:hypothetical protein K488DRAFT_86614 [Vararia minispora EC-137]